jgi:hypothetical protein
LARYKEWVRLETRGERLCREYARRSTDAARKQKWLLLADLEACTRAALERFLRSHDVAIEQTSDSGQSIVDIPTMKPWRQLLLEMRPRIARYVDELESAARRAEPMEQPIAHQLWEHEEAWLTFVDRELARDGERSMEAAKAHLAKWGGDDLAGES